MERCKFCATINSEDRFKCSLIQIEELIALDQAMGFTDTLNEYIDYQDERVSKTANRRILHAFPAEVNTVGYEDQLRELNQARRQFSDKVTLQDELLPAWQVQLPTQPDLQEDIDLASIFWLMLEDRVKQLLYAAERRIEAVPTTSKVPAGKKRLPRLS